MLGLTSEELPTVAGPWASLVSQPVVEQQAMVLVRRHAASFLSTTRFKA